jgi:NDP-sugar pyrophosphorylase family protein
VKAVILVGGEGTRLRPLTLTRLKSMVPMDGRPFLDYPLALLRRHGVREVVLSVCHRPERLRRHFGDGRRYGLRLHYARETRPLGTAGAIKNAERYLGNGPEPVVVLNGDILTDLDLTALAGAHRKRRALVTVALTRVMDPSAYGLVVLDPRHRILKFVEKPGGEENRGAWVNAGIYLFSPAALGRIPAGKAYSMERELFPRLLAAGEPLWGHPHRAYWLDIGTPARYLQANRDLLEHRLEPLPDGRALGGRPGVRIGRACRLHPSAHLRGPLRLGDACSVGPDARVGGSAVLGDRVRVGPEAVVANSVVWEDTVIGQGARLEGCVVGARVSIGRFAQVRAGTVLGSGARVPDYSRV